MLEEIFDDKNFIKEFYILRGHVDGMKDMMEIQFKNLKELIESNLEAINIATEKALASNDKRLDQMNEFRQSLKDQAATFLTRDYYDIQHGIIRDNIKSLEISKATIDAKADQKNVDNKFSGTQKATNRLLIVAVIAIVISILSIVFNYFKAPVTITQPKTEQTK